MPLGPVFNAELLTTARRWKFYALRFAYGLMVLIQIYLVYSTWSWRLNDDQNTLTINEMAQFAASIFGSFAFLQAAVVLMLTPALVGGVIADERQRKTLHYLLTSRLGGAEIVLGKLAARLLQLGVFLAMGLPVVSLIGLFGGIDPILIAATYAGTFTSMYFLATLSILVSVWSRTPREAITSLYLIGILWLLLPLLLLVALPNIRPDWWAVIGPWVAPVLDWLAISSPFYVLIRFRGGSQAQLLQDGLWVMGMQVVYGSIMAALAAFQLRSAFRRIEGGGRRRLALIKGVTRKRSWLPRPPCGDDGMLWKERYVARTAGVAKLSSFLIGVILFGLMIWSGYYFVEPVIREILVSGWQDLNSSVRNELNGFLIAVTVTIFIIWGLGVASAAASGVSSEREGDTWLSLIATPLSGAEILRAKMIGAAWSLRFLAYLLFAVLGVGLVLGSVHPLGVVFCLIEFATFSWFFVALGTAISLRSKNSTRALAATMMILMLVNGGYLFCCIPLRPNTPLILIGCMPVTLGFSVLDFNDGNYLLNWSAQQAFGSDGAETVMTGFVCVVGYAVAALVLTGHCFAVFDTVVDRPDRMLRPEITFQPKTKPTSPSEPE